jgi:hypothetical protein
VADELYTTSWTAERFELELVLRRAEDRLLERVPGAWHDENVSLSAQGAAPPRG